MNSSEVDANVVVDLLAAEIAQLHKRLAISQALVQSLTQPPTSAPAGSSFQPADEEVQKRFAAL